ncbi:Peptidyl-prolyl cis-trans isomerase A [Pseudozyma hubeiensis]|nr:Peptidyl-prolyl cis-trans isomerase A [Pseudozyma hubeiensis]
MTFADCRKAAVFFYLAIIASLLTLTVAPPVNNPLQTIDEDRSLPDVRASPFNPNVLTPQPIIHMPEDEADPSAVQPQVKSVRNDASWWRSWNIPWLNNRDPAAVSISSDSQLQQVIRNGPTSSVSDLKPDVAVTPIGRSWLGVKLPGNAWDGHVVAAMRQRAWPFFIAGSNGEAWYVKSDGTFKRLDGNQRGIVWEATHMSQNEKVPFDTLELPGTEAANAAAAKARSSTSWWSRISEGAKGWLEGLSPRMTNGIKYIRGP